MDQIKIRALWTEQKSACLVLWFQVEVPAMLLVAIFFDLLIFFSRIDFLLWSLECVLASITSAQDSCLILFARVSYPWISKYTLL